MCLGKGYVKGSVPASMHRETNMQIHKKTMYAIKVGFSNDGNSKWVFSDCVMPNFIISCSTVALLEHIAVSFLFWDLKYMDT